MGDSRKVKMESLIKPFEYLFGGKLSMIASTTDQQLGLDENSIIISHNDSTLLQPSAER